MKRSRAALVCIIALTGCTDVLPPDGGSSGPFSITVGTGTRPSYSWTAGPAFRVEVTRVENPIIPVWAVANTATQNIASPVTHGTIPSGSLELVDTEKVLTAGVRYRVTITLPNNDRSSRDFRP